MNLFSKFKSKKSPETIIDTIVHKKEITSNEEIHQLLLNLCRKENIRILYRSKRIFQIDYLFEGNWAMGMCLNIKYRGKKTIMLNSKEIGNEVARYNADKLSLTNLAMAHEIAHTMFNKYLYDKNDDDFKLMLKDSITRRKGIPLEIEEMTCNYFALGLVKKYGGKLDDGAKMSITTINDDIKNYNLSDTNYEEYNTEALNNADILLSKISDHNY